MYERIEGQHCHFVNGRKELLAYLKHTQTGTITAVSYTHLDVYKRQAENTRHMIIFDVLTHDSPVGWKGERTRLFLSDIGYEKALDSQANGQIKICLLYTSRCV